MTDAATALADTTKLPDYMGRPVVRSTISIRNAGDGLSEGLSIDPQVLQPGSTVYVVLECVVHAHDHDRLLDKGNDTGLMVLDQVLKAGTGTLMDADVVRDAIVEQAEKIERAKDAAAGRAKLPYPDELAKQHADGVHAEGLVEGCPDCDAEVAAAEAEAAVEQAVHEAEAADAEGDGEAPAEPTSIAGRRKR